MRRLLARLRALLGFHSPQPLADALPHRAEPRLAPPDAARVTRPIRRIVIHCTATPEGRDVTAADVDRWHRERGWNGIGYHALIRLDGSVEYGRPLEKQGAHARGHNHDTLAVVYAGGVDSDFEPRDTRTDAQIESLYDLVTAWQRQFGVPARCVVGHYELDPRKRCPSFSMAFFRGDLTRMRAAV